MLYLVALGVMAVCFAYMADLLWPPVQRSLGQTAALKRQQRSKESVSEQDETAKAA